MLLYHFTSAAHLRAIDKHGLTVGDVGTSFERLEGRSGVWLTSSADPAGHGLNGSLFDKTRIRLTVDVPEDDQLTKRTEWAPRNISDGTARRLIRAGGQSAETWYVYFRWIKRHRIINAKRTDNGELIEDLSEHWPEEGSVRAVPYTARHA